MESAIQFAQNLVNCLSGIEFQVIPNSDTAFLEHLNQTLDGLLFEFFANNERAILYRQLQPNCIYEYHTEIGLQYLFFLDQQEDRLFILGPVLPENYNEAFLRQKLRHLSLSQHAIAKILSRFSTLPTVSGNLLRRLCMLLVEHLTQGNQPVGYQYVNFMTELHKSQQAHPQNEMPKMRQVETRYELSSAITEAVRQGNLSMAFGLLNRYNPGVDTDMRNTDPLRNFQNYCIVLNTQLRHALETSGIHPYQLDRVSNEIGLEIENMRSTENVQDFIFLVIQRYCTLVRDSAYPNLKPLIHLTVTYIKEHLHEDLTVKETAKILGVNANYLSTQFQKNMGLSFIDFIHRERTNQAAALLKHTNMQIQQIASTVGYNNTSYFTKQFLHFQGMTPTHYRRDGIL